MLKVRFPKNTNENRPFLNFLSNLSKTLKFSEISFKGISFVKLIHLLFLSKILIISQNLFKGISFIKLNPPSLFWAKVLKSNRTLASLARTVPKPFPTKSVHTPFGVQKIYTARGEAPSLRVGWWVCGLTGYQKCPSIFFILCEYIGKVYIYLYM